MHSTCENNIITLSKVSSRKRANFLINTLGLEKAIKFENQVYQWCDNLCSDYNGGYWEFYTLSNGGFYMAPDISNNMDLEVKNNGYSCSLDADTIGIIVNLFTLSNLAFQYHMKTNIFTDKYRLLFEFADTHPNSLDILEAID